jgi:hypothetical protein
MIQLEQIIELELLLRIEEYDKLKVCDLMELVVIFQYQILNIIWIQVLHIMLGLM